MGQRECTCTQGRCETHFSAIHLLLMLTLRRQLPGGAPTVIRLYCNSWQGLRQQSRTALDAFYEVYNTPASYTQLHLCSSRCCWQPHVSSSIDGCAMVSVGSPHQQMARSASTRLSTMRITVTCGALRQRAAESPCNLGVTSATACGPLQGPQPSACPRPTVRPG